MYAEAKENVETHAHLQQMLLSTTHLSDASIHDRKRIVHHTFDCNDGVLDPDLAFPRPLGSRPTPLSDFGDFLVFSATVRLPSDPVH